MADDLSSQLQQTSLNDNDTPQTILRKMLSVRSVVSTSSSFAERNEEASRAEQLQRFSPIGQGNCGVVFEQIGTVHVVKRARDTGPESKALWNDFLMHKKVEQGFEVAEINGFPLVHVPRPILYVAAKDDAWWQINMHRFPSDFQSQANLLMSERIMPLPKVIREALIELYCPSNLRQAQFNEPGNKACLVRVHLGQNAHARQPSQRPQQFFTLRNFKLYLNQMKDLNLDINAFAIIMANALSVIHWQVQIDAADIEFVLGSAPVETYHKAPTYEQLKILSPDSSTYKKGGGLTFHKRVVHLWLLDFNCCKEIQMNDDGVRAASEAFALNDRYFPRPTVDLEFWNVFKNQYLEMSAQILRGTQHTELPKKFIEDVVLEMTRRAGRY